jgi:hypothetical protein
VHGKAVGIYRPASRRSDYVAEYAAVSTQTACNAHDDLIAAMRSAVAVLERSEAEARRKNLPHGIGDAIVYLTSALAKAGAL